MRKHTQRYGAHPHVLWGAYACYGAHPHVFTQAHTYVFFLTHLQVSYLVVCGACVYDTYTDLLFTTQTWY